MSSGRPDLSRIGFGVGWIDWKNLVCRTTSPSGCRTVSPSGCQKIFEPQFSLSNRDVVRSLVEVEVTCMLFRIKFLQSSV